MCCDCHRSGSSWIKQRRIGHARVKNRHPVAQGRESAALRGEAAIAPKPAAAPVFKKFRLVIRSVLVMNPPGFKLARQKPPPKPRQCSTTFWTWQLRHAGMALKFQVSSLWSLVNMKKLSTSYQLETRNLKPKTTILASRPAGCVRRHPCQPGFQPSMLQRRTRIEVV